MGAGGRGIFWVIAWRARIFFHLIFPCAIFFVFGTSPPPPSPPLKKFFFLMVRPLIQPTDLNEVLWLVYNILIPHCSVQKVCWRIMQEHYNTKTLFEGLRGQLCCGFAGGLQLSIKVLTQTEYPISRVVHVIQSFLTVYVQFRRYVVELSMNSTANGSSGSWSCLNFSALKIGGTVTYCLIIIVSLVANSLIAVIIFSKTPNLKKKRK